MKIILYRFSYQKTDIVKNLNNSETYTCTLRFPTNILNPIVRIQLDEPTSSIKNWSYAYIEEFGTRYYFVENIVAFTNNIYDLYLHVDVLYTYIGKNNSILRNDQALILRTSSSTHWNKLLNDSKLTFAENSTIEYKAMPDSTAVPFVFGNLTINSRNVLVSAIADADLISLIGMEGSDNIVPYEAFYPTSSDGVDIKPRATNFNCGTAIYLLTAEQAIALARICLKDATTRSYIKSFIVFPFDLTQTLNGTNYYIVDTSGQITFGVNGDYHTAQVDASYPQDIYICKRACFSYRLATTTISTLKTTLNQGSDFLNFGNYTKYELYLPYVGYVNIDWNVFCNYASANVVKIQLSGDLETGNMTYDIIINGIPYQSHKAKMGINVNLSSSNKYENEQIENAINNQEVTGAVVSAVTFVAGALLSAFGPSAMAGVPMMVGGAGGFATSVAAFEGQKDKIFTYGSSGTTTPNDGLIGLQKIIWRITKAIPSYNREYNAIVNEIGIPSMKVVQLKNCRGYNEFGKCEFSLENVKEQEELEDLLMNGVHFPYSVW